MHKNPDDSDLESLRGKMVHDQIIGRQIACQRTISAMMEVPRHEFLPEEMKGVAYDDCPQTIGYGQTISQPYMVALMSSQFQNLPKGSKILEVGSGCGYQTAVLVAMGFEVYSIEIVPELVKMSTRTLDNLGLSPTSLTLGDGKFGNPGEAPFDGIIAAACGDSIPDSWIEQMSEHAVLVAPVEGERHQMLIRIERNGDIISRKDICGVRFVRLV